MLKTNIPINRVWEVHLFIKRLLYDKDDEILISCINCIFFYIYNSWCGYWVSLLNMLGKTILRISFFPDEGGCYTY